MLISVAGLSVPRPQSLAISLWEIFELIIKESGDYRSDGKGRTNEPPSLSSFPSHHSPLAVNARSHHASLALLACLQLSRVLQSLLSHGKAFGGVRDWPVQHWCYSIDFR